MSSKAAKATKATAKIQKELLPAGQEYVLHLGDCIEHMATMPPRSVDCSIYSPPFPALYSYTNEESDIGNSEDLAGETKLHLSFFYRQILRVIKPGRVMVVHVTQIPRMKRNDERGGMFDFRGLNIRLAERAGFIYEYDWVIRKNPQSQAIRTKSRELQFSGLETDRARSRGAMGDYLIKFRVPGDNTAPVNSKDQVSRNEWIDWAECCWSDIRETETLNVRGTKSENDTRHICPLQTEVIDRLVRLYSNPGEIVFSPFAGIGSEGYVALKNHRRFYGCELKPEYHAKALENLAFAIEERRVSERTLFDGLDDAPEPACQGYTTEEA